MGRSFELLEVAQRSQDTYYQALALRIAGKSQKHMGESRASLDSFKQMLALPQAPDNKEIVQGWAYNGIGLAYQEMGQYQEAIKYANEDLKIKKRLRDESGQGRAYGDIGNAYTAMGQYKAAIEFLEKRLEIAKQLGDTSGQGGAYGNLGIAYDEMGEYTTAIQNFEKGLAIAQKLQDKPGQGRAYGCLGSVYQKMGQSDRAITYAQKQLNIAQRLNDKLGLQEAYCNLGNANIRLGQHQAAIGYHQQNLRIAEELHDMPGQGIAHGNLANAYSGLGQSQKAIDSGRKYLEIVQQLNDRPRQRIAHGNLGLYYAESGQLGLACSHFAESDALVREMEAPLADGQWRRHLLTFGENIAHFMDEWVLSAGMSGNMAEALRVEERRRCRSELAYQGDLVRGRQDVSLDKLKAMAKGADMAFGIVIKVYAGRLLTWALSGETGDLLYTNIEAITVAESRIRECVNCVTFAEWGRWQEQLVMARQSIQKKKREEQGREIARSWLESEIETLIPEDIRGDLSRELWMSMRDPETFERAVTQVGSPEILELQKHFLKKAEHAMDELEGLLWRPIVRECAAVGRALESKTRCDRPVSGVMRL